MRPLLLEHRIAVETELRQMSKGQLPPPHIVMDKLLDMNIPDLEYPASDAML